MTTIVDDLSHDPTASSSPSEDDNDDDDDHHEKIYQIISENFQKVSSLIRSSPPSADDAPVSDSIRLQLYGYYKCAANDNDNDNDMASAQPRPSFFDVVGRAKYDAWLKCEEECFHENVNNNNSNDSNSKCLAMRRYVEVAASQDRNAVGRKCAEIQRNMSRQIDNWNNLKSKSTVAVESSRGAVEGGHDGITSPEEVSGSSIVDGGDDDQNGGPGSCDNINGNTAKPPQPSINSHAKNSTIYPHRKLHQASNHPTSFSKSHSNSNMNILSPYLPPPLLPRGQLDISLLDLLYALWQCLQHALYACFFAPECLVHRAFSLIVPKFIVALVGMGMMGYHPRRRGEWHKREIERCWLDTISITNEEETEEEENAVSSTPEVVVGLSVRSLLDLYLTARSHPDGAEVVVVPPVNIPGMVEVMRFHNLTLVPIDLDGGVDGNESGAQEGGNEGQGESKSDQTPESNNNNDNNNSDSSNVRDKLPDADMSANATNKDNLRKTTSTTWGIDPIAIKAAITPKTVAILVVHPFGTIICNSNMMKNVQTIAHENGVEVWEDCAQCYTGKSTSTLANNDTASLEARVEKEETLGLGYTGSEYADISFFSFGPIKTATALGGGLAVLRNTRASSVSKRKGMDKHDIFCAEEVAQTMRRIQNSMYKPQSNLVYLVRVAKCLLVHLASQSRLLCGLIKSSVEACRWEYDALVLSLTRGFVASSTTTPTSLSANGQAAKNENDGNQQQRQMPNTELIRQLRKRPCSALLALLHRRLKQSDATAKVAARRSNTCRAFAKVLQSDKRLTNVVTLLSKDDGRSMYGGWLFPVLVSDPKGTSERLLQRGFDVPCGMTQLGPIASMDGNNKYAAAAAGEGGGCPRACAVFERILYLPVTNPSFGARDQIGLIEALVDATKSCGDERGSNKGQDENDGFDQADQLSRNKRQRPFRRRTVFMMFSLGFMEWNYTILGLFQYIPLFRFAVRLAIPSLRIILQLMILSGPYVSIGIALSLVLGLILCRYMGPIYLESSNACARYCGEMLFQSPFQKLENGCEFSAKEETKKYSQSTTVLELESTKIPTPTRVSNDDAENDNESQNKVLLTGATGFIGSLLLRELLLHRHALSIPGGVVVIVRSKRGRSARERVDRLLSQDMFDFLTENQRQSLVHVVEGDVTLPNSGMCGDQLDELCQMNVSHVFHCAAAVSFSQPLEDAAVSNITSSLQMQLLTQKLSSSSRRRKEGNNPATKFVYVSTAFVHGGNTGTPSEPLPGTKLFSLRRYDPWELYKSMLGSQSYASSVMNELGFPNTYTFSKCVCEHLLLLQQSSKEVDGIRPDESANDVETIIVRPSIVGPSVQQPHEGWAGEKPSTIVAAACLYLKFPYNIWCFGKQNVPFVPVDVVCRCVISKAFAPAGGGCSNMNFTERNDVDSCSKEDEKKEMSIRDVEDVACEEIRTHCSTISTVAWDSSSPATSSFTWQAYAFSITHLGIICGHVSRLVAYVGLLLSTILFPRLNLRLDTFERLHSWFVRAPLDGVVNICNNQQRLPIPWRGRKSSTFVRDLKALSNVVDLPVLFFRFSNQSYYFESDLVAPDDFNGERYMFSCVVAAHHFIQMIEVQRKKKRGGSCTKLHLHESNLRVYSSGETSCNDASSASVIIAGANHVKPISDLWWALTQPKGNIIIRLGGWILTKIFRHTALEIEIDAASFLALSRSMSENSSCGDRDDIVIIAPTHRSFYDFLIVSYVCFAMPELGLDIPHIAAASDFASIPVVGWLAEKCNAFFLKRGTKSGKTTKKTNRSGNLNESVSRIITLKRKQGQRRRPTLIEVFIEGKRSRSRTFLEPKTGFLRCLAEVTTTGEKHNRQQDSVKIFPLTINYECLVDEVSLIKEANNGHREKMSLGKLMNWLYSVFVIGNVNIGRVYVTAASQALAIRPDFNTNDDQKDNNIRKLAHTIQSHHQNRVTISKYHIRAASLVLELPQEVVMTALMELGCQIWPELDKGASEIFPQNGPICHDRDLAWSAMMQFGHSVGPFIATSHPKWSSLLCPLSTKRLDGNGVDEVVSPSNTAIKALLSKLTCHFEIAERTVDDALKNLRSKGYHSPDEGHVIQYLPTTSDVRVPMFLMRVAVKAKVAAADGAGRGISKRENSLAGHWHGPCDVITNGRAVKPLFASSTTSNMLECKPNAEAFGAWGYTDSHFVLNVKPDGSKCVMMKGTRYGISGKPLTKLASFVEKELNVAIDPNGVTFPSACGEHLQRTMPESNLTNEDVANIVSLFGGDDTRSSVSLTERARHGSGHTQEDMYDLRSGNIRFRPPDLVVWPKNETEIQALICVALKCDWCLVPFGGGTNVTHSTHCPHKTIDPRPMISVDMKLLKRVLWINEEDGLAHVEAGITGRELICSMEKLGFTIGHEPDSYEFSTLGGWIATKASGMKQNKYGNIEDIVREVRVVGSKGSIMSHEHKLRKTSVGRSSMGIDLKSLVLGSEGCLGIVVSAVIKIWPLAESRSHGSVLFPDFDTGLRYMKDLSKLRALKPASVRLLDNNQFRLGQALKPDPSSRYESLCNLASKKIAGYFLGNFSEQSVVCATIAFEGTVEEIKLQKKSVQQLASTYGGILAGSNVGRAGYDLTFAIAYLRDFALNYHILGESFETFVPWSKLSRVIEATKSRICSEHRSRALPGVPFVCCRITQLYDDGACVYFYFCMNINGVLGPSDVFSEIERAARQAILDNGGSLSHHHGLGKLRSDFVRQVYSQGHLDSIVAVKEALDPENTFGARNGMFAMMNGSNGP